MYLILLVMGLYPPSSLVGVESRDVPRRAGGGGGDLHQKIRYVGTYYADCKLIIQFRFFFPINQDIQLGTFHIYQGNSQFLIRLDHTYTYT